MSGALMSILVGRMLNWGVGQRMKIAIDIDEVLAEFVKGYMKFVAGKGFKEVKYEDIFCYELWEVFGIEEKLAFDLAGEFNLTEEFDNIDLVDGAVEGVNFLNKKYEIYFITARPRAILKKTRDFIFSNFGILGNNIIFSGDMFKGQNKAKDEICRDFGIDLIVEDNIRHSLNYAKNGLKVLLLDKPWNRGVECDNIFGCKDWGDILRKVEELRDV